MDSTEDSEALFGEALWWAPDAPLRSVTCTAHSQASVLPRVGVHPKSRLTLCLLVLCQLLGEELMSSQITGSVQKGEMILRTYRIG